MNWRAISSVVAKVLATIAIAALVTLAAMYSFITFFDEKFYSDGKVIFLGISVFVITLIVSALHAYNLSNEYRRRAHRRRRVEKRRSKKMTVDQYDSFNREFKRQMTAVMNLPVAKASMYDLPLD